MPSALKSATPTTLYPLALLLIFLAICVPSLCIYQKEFLFLSLQNISAIPSALKSATPATLYALFLEATATLLKRAFSYIIQI